MRRCREKNRKCVEERRREGERQSREYSAHFRPPYPTERVGTDAFSALAKSGIEDL